MDAQKVYYPEVIADTPFPNEDANLPYTTTSGAPQGAGGIYSPQKINEQAYPLLKIAQELLSTSLNTHQKRILGEFQFSQMGAIQIGQYINGITGDLRLSPGGITARDLSGNTTFDLDAETGDATFAGTIQAGTFIAGAVAVGGDAIVLDGAGQRITMTDSLGNTRIVIGEV